MGGDGATIGGTSSADRFAGQPGNRRLHLADRPALRGDGHAHAGQCRGTRGRHLHLRLAQTPGAYLINASTGASLKSLPVGSSRVFRQPVFAQGTLFIATETPGLYDFAP